MSKFQEEERLPVKKLLQGSMLILISNLIYIGNNYLVAWTQLKATEIALVRGGLQVIVFGIIIWRMEKPDSKISNDSGKYGWHELKVLLISKYFRT